MRISEGTQIDYEPLSLILQLPALVDFEPGRVEEAVARWFQNRRTRKPCPTGCTQKFVLVTPRDKHEVQVLLQWVCPVCLPSLITFLKKHIIQLEVVQIGDSGDSSEQLRMMEGNILTFGERTVTFEDGHQETVKPFKITQRAVSVAEYAGFCQETGYQTVLERRKWPTNFRRNPLIRSNSDDARMLSYEDASAFCTHRGVRLPTEAEYLAAALIDDQVHGLDGWQIAEVGKSAGILKVFSPVITATLTEGCVVIRRGPHIAKTAGWQGAAGRALFALDKPAGAFCFCASTGSADSA